MTRGRTFTTLPTRAIGDDSLTALEWRCLAAIGIHDGMSLWKGKGGPGCFAKHATLAREVGVDVTSFSRALTGLQIKGYVEREQHPTDKRRFTLRVIPDHQDSCPHGQQSDGALVDDAANYYSEIVDDAANQIVDNGEHENGSFPSLSEAHYSHRLDLAEATGINSAEAVEDFGESITAIARSVGKARRVADYGSLAGKDSAKAGLSRVSLFPHMPRDYRRLDDAALLAAVEQALGAIDWRIDACKSEERQEIELYLIGQAEGPQSDRANLILDELARRQAA